MINYTLEQLQEFAKICQIYFGEGVSYGFVTFELECYLGYKDYYEKHKNDPIDKNSIFVLDKSGTMEDHIKERFLDKRKRELEAVADRKASSLPWYERELSGYEIKPFLIESFIEDETGKAIFKELNQYWSITPEMFVPALKLFASKANLPTQKIEEFVAEKRLALESNGNGVTADGQRVFRAITWTCNSFYKYCKGVEQ